MTASTTSIQGTLLPRATHAPGELLWGEAPRRQPIAPLVLMAVLLLLVAVPSAMGGGGEGSRNPMVLMRQIADTTYELTGLMEQSNSSLAAIDENSSSLADLQGNMAGIAAATGGMESKTRKLNEKLGGVGAAVTGSRTRLASVDDKLDQTASGMGSLRTAIAGSAGSTKAIVQEFGQIDTAIGSMSTNLKTAITKMATSAPLTKAFANNRTRVEIAGGSTKKYAVRNYARDIRVMSVVLPMIKVMQEGGELSARKDRHEASNFIVGTALKMQVPDGTNVVAIVKPFDGISPYGLPNRDFFVNNRIHGF